MFRRKIPIALDTHKTFPIPIFISTINQSAWLFDLIGHNHSTFIFRTRLVDLSGHHLNFNTRNWLVHLIDLTHCIMRTKLSDLIGLDNRTIRLKLTAFLIFSSPLSTNEQDWSISLAKIEWFISAIWKISVLNSFHTSFNS